MKNTIKLIPLAAILSTSALAVDGLSGNVGFTNNYLWRNISQTHNAAAVSGGIDYDAGNGFSAGAWASNADIADNMSYELDFYGAYSNKLNNDLSYSIGYIYYSYDNDADSNLQEVNFSLTYDAYSITYNTIIDSDWGSDFGDDTYISADATFDIADGLELGLHIGSYDFEASEKDYIDYGVSLRKSGFTFAISDTDKDDTDGDVNFIVSYTMNINL